MTLKQLALPALALLIGATTFTKASALALNPIPAGYSQERGDWETPPQELQEIQRIGFHDGIEGARKDFDNHRRPDVNNRDEYRHPQLPWSQRQAYRDGFQRGYERAMSHLMGKHDEDSRPREMNDHPRDSHDLPQGPGSEVQRRGFQDGMEGARRDFDNHRRPDPNNRDEYRHPNVPLDLYGGYREGFRRGYEKTMSQLMGDRR